MSLSSLLLEGAKKDDSLDVLFASNPSPPKRPAVPITIPSNSPKSSAVPITIPSNPPPKRSAVPITVPSNPPVEQQRGKKRKHATENISVDVIKPVVQSSTSPKPAKRQKSAVLKSQKLATKTTETVSESKKGVKDDKDNDESEDDENDPTLEDSYLARRSAAAVPKESVVKQQETATDTSEEEVEDEDEDDSDAPLPVHETLTSARLQKQPKRAKKTKYVPLDETPPQRAARTIFVGNIPIAIAKSRPGQKALKRHITTLVPGAKIESIRFRSVAFAAPTAPPEASSEPSTKEKRQIERTTAWRNTDVAAAGENKPDGKGKRQMPDEETSDRVGQSKKPGHATLTPAQKKKVAFIKGKFHDGVDSINAYIVFAHPAPVSEAAEPSAASNPVEDDPTSSILLDPTEATRLAALHCDGTIFMERTIRVDRVGDSRTKSDGTQVMTIGDPRATVFVGNLDFATKEEELRVWFEGVIAKEMGPPPEEEDSNSDDAEAVGVENGVKKRKLSWVRSVRIVRDRDTQLGKGFAYVRFADRQCVDELLNLDASALKFAKRTLRVQRYKGIPGATPKSTVTTGTARNKKTDKSSSGLEKRSKPQADGVKAKVKRISGPVVVPKGDPSLGSKLVGLSKEERKTAKASNADRIQRRLAKKQAKGIEKSSIERAEKHKERKRERKSSSGNKAVLKARIKGKSKPGKKSKE